ncbi:hypothetical protein HU200_001304 [Digitaria exilis]|uniref:Uncharacterized protein n=1 Tax=Digitaria exilis TaxID=1010633 RepID=A0A835KWK0_9POAL|nr:hypothetical protein HU200_001304 [Digitaria exilis]
MNNPRFAASDGVPPDVVIVGFRGASATGGAPARRFLTIARSSAFPSYGEALGTPPFSPTLPTIEVRDPAIARRLLFNHGDAFSNRLNPFPLDFTAGRYHSIGTVPYGPALTADILHPTRLGLMKPLQREAVECLVSGLSDAAGEEEVVVVRGSLHCSAYALMSRLCFGDGTVDLHDTSAIDRAQHEFLAFLLETVAMLPRCVPSVVKDRGHSTNVIHQLALPAGLREKLKWHPPLHRFPP